MTFEELSLPEPLLKAIDDLGFVEPTPIQAKGLPPLLEGKDVAGQAQTGTGKTACFLLGVMNRLLDSERPEGGRPRALVVAPTRELAIQIAADGEALSTYTDLTFALGYGGTAWEKQAKVIEAGCDVIVGTPGRLIDYYKRGVLRLDRIESVVIDEADRMFDMGFVKDITYLLRACPPKGKRQSCLFSATLSQQVMNLAWRQMVDPVEVAIKPDKIVVDAIDQTLYHVAQHEKVPLLLGLFKREMPKRAIIFVNTKRDGERLTWKLNQNGISAVYISGDVAQKKRGRIIDAAKAGYIDVLVATDVASRGIHVDDVSHVFNYDLPEDPEDYVHRIGRTARAGAKGKAISLACERFVYGLSAIQKYIGGEIPVEWAEDADFMRDQSGYFHSQRGKVYTGWPPPGLPQAEPKPDEPKKKKKRRRKKDRDAEDAPAESAEAPAESADSAGETSGQTSDDAAETAAAEAAPAKKKRRRRRRKSSDGEAAPASEASEAADKSEEKPAKAEASDANEAPKADDEPAEKPAAPKRERRKRVRRKIGE